MANTDYLLRLSYSPLLSTKRDQEFFTNRDEEIQQALQAVEAGFNVLVIGERGLGKTTVLTRLEYLLKGSRYEKKLVVPANLNFEIASPSDFILLLLSAAQKTISNDPRTRLVQTIRRAAESVSLSVFGAGVSLKPPEEISVSLRYRFLDEFLTLCSKIRAKGMQFIFLIDDTDKSPEVTYDVLSSLRDTLWRTEAVYVLTCNAMHRSVVLRPPVDSFFESVIQLHSLDYEETVDLIRKRLGKDIFPRETYAMIHSSSKGNPREIVRVCRMAIEKAIEEKWEPQRLEEGVRHLIMGLEHTRQSYDKTLSLAEKELVRYIETHGPCSSSDKNLQALLGVKRTRLVQIFKKLERIGILKATTTAGSRRKLYGIVG